MIYSDAAKKKVGTYLSHKTDITLGGIKNNYTLRRLNEAALDALDQIIIDNPAVTGYADALKLIEKEKEND